MVPFPQITLHRAPRNLLASAAVLLLGASCVHAFSYRQALAAIPPSGLPALSLNIYRTFWFVDSANMVVLAAIVGWIALRPSAAQRSIIILLSLVPASTAVLIFHFVGNFFGAYVLTIVAGLVFIGGLISPGVDAAGP